MDPLEPIFASLDWALRSTSRVVLFMTHPAFRQPRHAGWGFDPTRKLTYRRVDAYLGEMAVPMKALGDARTVAFHRPISTYVNGLASIGFAVDAMAEIPDLPAGQRPRAGAPRRGRTTRSRCSWASAPADRRSPPALEPAARSGLLGDLDDVLPSPTNS